MAEPTPVLYLNDNNEVWVRGPRIIKGMMNDEAAHVLLAHDDLVAALKALYDACEYRANQEGGDFGELIGPAAEMARAALAKAGDRAQLAAGAWLP